MPNNGHNCSYVQTCHSDTDMNNISISIVSSFVSANFMVVDVKGSKGNRELSTRLLLFEATRDSFVCNIERGRTDTDLLQSRDL